jgi:hypothetical protein
LRQATPPRAGGPGFRPVCFPYQGGGGCGAGARGAAFRRALAARQEAEAAKNRGNAHFQQQLYVAAVSEYTAAISMSRQRGFAHPAMAAIYYSNRAAAHMKLDRHEVPPPLARLPRREAACPLLRC